MYDDDWSDGYADPQMSRDADMGPDPDAGMSWVGKALAYGAMLCIFVLFVLMLPGFCR